MRTLIFLFVSLCGFNGVASELDYSQFLPRSVGDVKRICAPFIAGESRTVEDMLNAAACTGYFSGLIDGYDGTLSVHVERQTSRNLGLELEAIKQQMKTDDAMHRELSEAKKIVAFLCIDDSIWEVINVIVSNLEAYGEQVDDKYAYYELISELSRVYPCEQPSK